MMKSGPRYDPGLTLLIFWRISIAERRGLIYTGPGLHILVQARVGSVPSLSMPVGVPVPVLALLYTADATLPLTRTPLVTAVLRLKWV